MKMPDLVGREFVLAVMPECVEHISMSLGKFYET